MNTQCTICRHPKREEIEDALVRRVPMRRIARRYGVSKSAVGRHIRSHVAEELLEMMRERLEAQGRRSATPACAGGVAPHRAGARGDVAKN